MTPSHSWNRWSREPTTALAYRELALAQSNASRPDAEEHTLREGIERFPKEAALHAHFLIQTCRDRKPGRGRPRRVTWAPEQSAEGRSKGADALIQAAMAPPTRAAVVDGSLHSARGHSVPIADAWIAKIAACASKMLGELTDSAVRDSPDYLELKSRALAMDHKKAEALAAIGLAIQREPKQPRYLITQGSFYQEFSDQVSAVQSYLNALKLDPESPLPLYLIAVCFCALGVY